MCYRKRIKCDQQKPRCSNCILYRQECTFEAASRKWRPKKQKGDEGGAIEALQARVASLEQNLAEAQQRINDLEGRGVAEIISTSFAPGRGQGADPNIALVGLPTLQDTLSVAERYLATTNRILPLFHPERLLQLINGWHTGLGRRDSTVWAAINVVLALASRERSYEQMTPGSNLASYVRNIQSVLTEIIMAETDLLTVQVLVGMAMLFQGIQDLKPATILIAIALRLAHHLGLHAPEFSGHSDSSITLERSRVFWLAYILDRDISMRTGKPPVQRDADIQASWVLQDAEDECAGYVDAGDGGPRFNFFQARIRLAQIQGDIREAMHSPHTSNQHGEQRVEDIARLGHRLDDWMSQVPQQFQPDKVASTGKSSWLRGFGVLFASHLACRALLCRAHVMELQWLRSLQDYGASSIRDGIMVPAPRPQGWSRLVDDARKYLALFERIECKDPAFLW